MAAGRHLIVGHDAERNGATLYLLELVRSFVSDPRMAIGVALASDGPLVADFARLAPTIVTRNAASAATAFWAESSPDAVLAHSVVSHLALENWPHRESCLVSYIQELESEIERSGAPVVLQSFPDQRFIAGAECVRTMLVDRFSVPRVRVEVVRNGIDPEKLRSSVGDRHRTRARLGVDDSVTVVMGSGPVCWRKGTDLFVQVAAKVARSAGHGGMTKFIWFGRLDEPATSHLRRDLAQMGLTKRVDLLPPTQEAAAFFNAADIYLLTSREDPFSRALLEVLALGVPAVAFRQGGVEELGSRGLGLQVVDYADTGAMAAAVVKLLDPVARKRHAAAGRRLASQFRLTDAVRRTKAMVTRHRSERLSTAGIGSPMWGATLALDGGRPVRETPLIFGRPIIDEEDVQAVVDVLRSGWIGRGPVVAEFEESFQRFLGCRNAVALSSCTAALHLALLAAGARPGTEVITSTLTFPATVNAILQSGAEPVLADIDTRTQVLDLEMVLRLRTDRTVAVVPVDMAGYPFPTQDLMEWAPREGIAVVEDAAHCIEGWSGHRKVGTIADATCFSFYPTKNITTIDGGLVATERDDWAEVIRLRAAQGVDLDAWGRTRVGSNHYVMKEAGYKSNLTDVHAALGLVQLRRIEGAYNRRSEIWRRYDEAFAGLPLVTPVLPMSGRHARHLYTVHLRLEDLRRTRDDVLDAMRAENVQCAVHYRALHLQPYFMQRGHQDFPAAEWVSERTLSLPLSPAMTDRDVEDVVGALHKVLRAFER